MVKSCLGSGVLGSDRKPISINEGIYGTLLTATPSEALKSQLLRNQANRQISQFLGTS
jgi:hypothetical protein